MHHPFPDDTTDSQAVTVLGRSVHPGFIDVPFFTNEILDARGSQNISGSIPVDELSDAECEALDRELDDYERDVREQLGIVRRDIMRRRYALDVIGQQTLGLGGTAA